VPCELAHLDQVQAERLDLSQHAVQGRPVQQAGEHGVGALPLRQHRRERRQHGGAEVAVEFDVSERLDWNAKTIAEFRANEGRVGGNFEGAPMVLVHHRGRKSGREYVNPMMYLPHDTEPDIIYVFATKGGAPTNPDWYHNLTAAGDGSVERGTETYKVTVRELTGAERDRIYAEQARRYPGFAEYARQTARVRTIPVLELRRA
jgi:deazaflavin-dependent oxidoreductase (nitroreductase family)